MPHAKKVSQIELAKELGISQALVSLVLNGRKTGINPETYARVWAHASKRGYLPKGMRFAAAPSNRPRQVGFILRAPLRLHTQSVYFGLVQHGMHTALESLGLNTVFLGSEDLLDVEKLGRLFETGHSYKGVVLLGEVSRPFFNQLREFERRLVIVSARIPGLCHSVLGNEPQALDVLVRHLVELGHRRIGWLGGNLGLGTHASRLSAFKAALKTRDLELNERYCLSFENGDRAVGMEAVQAVAGFAARKDFPTAFVCYNTLMATGAVLALGTIGMRVPKDVSVCAADVSPLASSENPRITASGTSPDKLGEAAARLIMDTTGSEDESFTDLMLPSQLFVGDTTGQAR